MSILVTGSTGFIGARLCQALAQKGHKVHALYRSEARARSLTHPGITPFKGDILDVKSLERAIEGCTQVYHTAAFTGVWARDSEEIYQLNVTGTLNILDTCLRKNVRDIVITSTAGVFGPSENSQVNEFTKSILPYFTYYESTKALAEAKALDYLKQGLNIRVVNPTRVFGPGRLSQSNSVTKMILGYPRGKWRIIPGNGHATGNYAFVDDVVRGHILAMEKGKPGHNYILGGHDLSYNEFFDRLAEVSGRKRKMIHLPAPLMMFMAKASMLGWSVARIKPFITPGLVRKYSHHWKVSSAKAIGELGYTVTPFEEALEITLLNSQK